MRVPWLSPLPDYTHSTDSGIHTCTSGKHTYNYWWLNLPRSINWMSWVITLECLCTGDWISRIHWHTAGLDRRQNSRKWDWREREGGKRWADGRGRKVGGKVKKRQRREWQMYSYLVQAERFRSHFSRSPGCPSIPSLIFCLKLYLIKKKLPMNSLQSLIYSEALCTDCSWRFKHKCSSAVWKWH